MNKPSNLRIDSEEFSDPNINTFTCIFTQFSRHLKSFELELNANCVPFYIGKRDLRYASGHLFQYQYIGPAFKYYLRLIGAYHSP